MECRGELGRWSANGQSKVGILLELSKFPKCIAIGSAWPPFEQAQMNLSKQSVLTLIPFLALTGSNGKAGRDTIEQCVQNHLHDISLVAEATYANKVQLGKIGPDFGDAYRLPRIRLRLKEPFMLRGDGALGRDAIRYVINGPKREISMTGLRLFQDLSRSPGKRQTFFDLGLLTPSLFKNLYAADLVEAEHGPGLVVFDVRYLPEMDDSSKSRVWIDTYRKVIQKREWFNQHGRLLATFYYGDPHLINGVFVPTRVEVRTADDVLAAITFYRRINLNAGLNSAEFAIGGK